MYNRRPMNKYKKYDKIYFIVPDNHLIIDYIEKLQDLFKEHTDFIKDIKEFEMANKLNPNQNTTFINIRMNTRELNEGIFPFIKNMINKRNSLSNEENKEKANTAAKKGMKTLRATRPKEQQKEQRKPYDATYYEKKK